MLCHLKGFSNPGYQDLLFPLLFGPKVLKKNSLLLNLIKCWAPCLFVFNASWLHDDHPQVAGFPETIQIYSLKLDKHREFHFVFEVTRFAAIQLTGTYVPIHRHNRWLSEVSISNHGDDHFLLKVKSVAARPWSFKSFLLDTNGPPELNGFIYKWHHMW